MVVTSSSMRHSRASERRDKLVLENMEFVRHILGRVVAELPPGIDEENLLSAGTVGLIEAATNFDEERGVAFRTFAYRRVRGAIIDELRRNCPLPQRVLENLSLVRTVRQKLTAPVLIEELAVESGLTVNEVEECLEASRLTAPQSWIGEEGTWGAVGQRHSHRPELAMEVNELQTQLATAIEQLPESQRLTVTLYYLEGLRLKEIGAVLGRSESRISRILTQAEHSLREAMRTVGLASSADLPPEMQL